MFNPMDLSGKHVLVTGASSGIGRETAILLSRLAAQVTITGRNQERLERTLRLLQGTGHRAVTFDLNELGRIPAWMKEQASVNGPFYGVVHAAGFRQTTPLRVLEVASLEEMMRVNFQSGAMIARGFRQKGCRAPGSACLIFLGSISGLVGDIGISAYSASKAALLGLTRSLAIELASERIRVNAVAPGIVASELWERAKAELTAEQIENIERKYPIGIGTVTDVANGIAFLLADTGRWLTGTTLVMDGGYTAF